MCVASCVSFTVDGYSYNDYIPKSTTSYIYICTDACMYTVIIIAIATMISINILLQMHSYTLP